MAYEEADARMGVADTPTWVLSDILERLDPQSVRADALRLILRRRTTARGA